MFENRGAGGSKLVARAGDAALHSFVFFPAPPKRNDEEGRFQREKTVKTGVFRPENL